MTLLAGLFRAVGVAALSWLALVAPSSGPTASFEVKPGHPSAGAPVQFEDASTGMATAWEWSFGDGEISRERNPEHVYAAPGNYSVTLKVADGMHQTQTASMISVSDAATLTLLSADGHAFEITLDAVNPANGQPGQGQAVPQNDVFGYFTIPALVPTPPGAPLVPEVFVKMLDARAIGQDFWVFWGGLTGLEYTLTVRDTVRGTQKVYHNPVTNDPNCLSADTSGFAGAAPSPTPTPPPGGAVHVVNVGQGGTQFVDVGSGTHVTTVHVGDTVQWNWMSGPHSSTSGSCKDNGGYYGGTSCTDSGVWDSGIHNMPNMYSWVATQAGSFTYHCDVHGAAMMGTVVVQNP